MGAYCGGSQKSVSREKELSRRRSKVERGAGGRGRGTLGWKGPGLTTLPASINPIKLLKNQITCEAFNMNFSLCHGRGCMEEGSRKQQNHPVGMGGPLAHLLQDTHACSGEHWKLYPPPSSTFCPLFKKNLTYSSLAALGLCYRMWAFSSCHEGGLLCSFPTRALGGADSRNCGTPASLL